MSTPTIKEKTGLVRKAIELKTAWENQLGGRKIDKLRRQWERVSCTQRIKFSPLSVKKISVKAVQIVRDGFFTEGYFFLIFSNKIQPSVEFHPHKA